MIETTANFGSEPEVLPEPGASGRPALDATSLGASLYVPAIRPDLSEILAGRRFRNLRSMIVCLEDSIAESELDKALENLRLALREPFGGKLLRFLRPRSPGNLAAVKGFPGFGRFDGLVLPKVTLASLAAYVRQLEGFPEMPILPILETEHVFDYAKLEKIADALERLPNPIAVVRIGGNDILNLLGIRRPRGLTVYETPLRDAIIRILSVFRPRGLAVAAPVYEHFRDIETLRRETGLDVAHGLLTKSAIHPSQLPVIEEAYAPTHAEMAEARQIAAVGSPAVFKLFGSMCEPSTHRRWATEVIARAAVFGVRPVS